MSKINSKFICFLILAFIFSAIFYVYKFKSLKNTPIRDNRILAPSPTNKAMGVIKTGLIKVENPDKIFLFSNLAEKKDSEKLLKDGNCSSLISGGFYTKENKHIGIFISEKSKISSATSNTFYNGFISVSDLGIVTISTLPNDNARISLQSGPLIFLNGKPQHLKPNNDESARRVVVAQTDKESEVLFIIFYNSENSLFGPKLTEIPDLLQKLEMDQSLKIINALNLDGGSHSAFLTPNLKIPEIQTVGSYFCITN